MSDEIKDDELALLDMSLEDIEDLPGFTVPVNGEYNLKINGEVKKVSDKVAIEIAYEVIDCIKQNDEAEVPTTAGTKFSQLFFMQGTPEALKMSKGKLKELLAGVAEQVGEGNLLLLVRDHLKNRTGQATVTRRPDKDDKEKFHANVKNLTIDA